MPELIFTTLTFYRLWALPWPYRTNCHCCNVSHYIRYVLHNSPRLRPFPRRWLKLGVLGHAGHVQMGSLRWNSCVSYPKGRSQPHKRGERWHHRAEARKRRGARPPVLEAPGLYPHPLDGPETAKGRWDRLIEELGQPALEEGNTKKGLTGELPSATGKGSGQMQRRGKCHAWGEEGHNVRDRRAPKEEPTGVPTSKAPSGAAEQPETGPANPTNAASLEGEGRSLQAPTHAQNIGGELKASSDEPGAIESQPGNTNANSSRRSR